MRDPFVDFALLPLGEALHCARSYILRQPRATRRKIRRNLRRKSLDRLQSIATCYRLTDYTFQPLFPTLWQDIALQLSALSVTFLKNISAASPNDYVDLD